MMEILFETIINNLRERKSINDVTKEIKLNISNGSMEASSILLAFIEYLKANYLNENNSEIFTMIEKYFSNQISLQDLSQGTFLKKVIVDQDKRDGYQAQFRHSPDETFLDEMFRVIYEFTRNDLVMPKGVCYDFCLFIAGLSIAKNDKKQLYIWNSIEKSSGENNFILFSVEEDKVVVYDPFNAIYVPLENYNMSNVGFKLIKLDKSNILKESIKLTSFELKIIYYDEIIKIFSSAKKSEDDELEALRNKNYYQRLSVDRNATFNDIKSSFRKLLAKYHPDINPNDKHAKEKTQLIIEAYECLKSTALRAEYDSKIFESSTENKSQKPSDDTQASTSSVSFEEELERIIREFKTKYNVDSYEDILKLLIMMTRETVRKESGKDDIRYNQNTMKFQNIVYNIYNINNKIIPNNDHNKVNIKL